MIKISIGQLLSFSFYILILCFVIMFIHNIFKGDVNYDHKITALDIVKTQRYINGYRDDLSFYDKFLMDVNMDFKIDEQDILELRKIIVNK